ncbi:uncharacterized protein EI90DRAFT_3036336, partial [Cantharellus anzutake]|uniref:uncharacterized protein n=1 Tax=Cantharellus anzutake TaxID=1750568 RepID=UPI00190613E4
MTHLHSAGPFLLDDVPRMSFRPLYSNFDAEETRMKQKEDDFLAAKKFHADAKATVEEAKKAEKLAKREFEFSRENYRRRLGVEREVGKLYRKRGVHPLQQTVTTPLAGVLSAISQPLTLAEPGPHQMSPVQRGSPVAASYTHFPPYAPRTPRTTPASKAFHPSQSYFLPTAVSSYYPYAHAAYITPELSYPYPYVNTPPHSPVGQPLYHNPTMTYWMGDTEVDSLIC